MTEPARRPEDYIVRTRDLTPESGVVFRHPLNENSNILMHMLSSHVGMARVQLSLGRVSPGRESFVPHAHTVQEEFLFILEGSGQIEIDGARAPVGPGDYIGFPTDGAVHQLYNTGTLDLVYLMGGERTEFEVSQFPTLGKTGVWANGEMRFFDRKEGTTFTVEDFFRPEDDGR